MARDVKLAKNDAGNRIELLDPIVSRLNAYRAEKAPHMPRPAIVTEALIEYLDKREGIERSAEARELAGFMAAHQPEDTQPEATP